MLGALHRTQGNRVVQRFVDSFTRGGEAPADTQQRLARSRGGGQALQTDLRLEMESAFGADLRGVRLHTDAAADQLSRSLQARAFTTGRDIYFQTGAYDPGGAAGRRLLAHEMTHVVQQAGAPETSSLSVGPVDDAFEHEADRVADSFVRSPVASLERATAGGAGGSIQRMCASCASHQVHDEESMCPTCRSASPRQIQRQPQPQQQRLPPGTHPDVKLDPHSAEAVITQAIEALGDFKVSGKLTEPGNVITDVTGVPLGLPRSTIDVSVAYDDRCNRALQSALVGVRQQQAAGRSVFDFSEADWTAVGKLGIRIGSTRADGSVEASFNGDRFQALTFTLTFTPGVSEAIPDECLRRPDTPGKPPGGGGSSGLCEGFDCNQPRSIRNYAMHTICCLRPPRETPDTERPRTTTPGLPPRTVYYFYDTSIFKPGGIDTLNQVFDALDLFPTLEVQITGHTSLEGTEDYNTRLSRSRAEMARDMLSLRGIASSRLHVLPMGEYAPAVVEPEEPAPRSLRLPSGEAIRDLNRRAEIVFFDPTGTVPGVPTMPRLTLTVPRAFPRLSTPFRLGQFGFQPPSP